MRLSNIARAAEFFQNLRESLALIRVLEAAHVLCEEPLRAENLQGFDAIGIKRSEGAVHPLLLTHSAVVIAGKAESEGVDPGQLFQIELADISMVNGIGIIRADIAAVRLAGALVVVVRPLMNNPEIRIADVGMQSAPGQSARTAEQFTQSKMHSFSSPA
jgi:hypothetical protein